VEQPERTVGEWLRDLEARMRKLEYTVWAFGGAVAVLQLLRACT
jgi:hypothetical protein